MMRELGLPVVFDVTHSLQLPGAGDGVTLGLAEYIAPLARAGVAAGVDGVFMEVHEDPPRAKSDAANALRLDLLEPLLTQLVAIDRIARPEQPWLTCPSPAPCSKPRRRPSWPWPNGSTSQFSAAVAAGARLQGPADPDRHGQVGTSSAARSPRRSRAPALRPTSSIPPKPCTATSA